VRPFPASFPTEVCPVCLVSVSPFHHGVTAVRLQQLLRFCPPLFLISGAAERPGSSCSGGWGIFLAAMVVDDEVIGVVDVRSIITREDY